MTLAKLQEVIRLKQRPETMLSLETAIQQGEQTVVHYRQRPRPGLLDTGGVWGGKNTFSRDPGRLAGGPEGHGLGAGQGRSHR